MIGARRFLAVQPDPKEGQLLILCLEAAHDLEGLRMKDVIDLLWPWEDGPRGNVRGLTYQLSSDQQHRIGVHGIYCLYEDLSVETPDRVVGGTALFFRTKLPGRALLLGVENNRIALFHDLQAQEVNALFAYMQQSWGDRYHGYPANPALGQSETRPVEPALH